MQEHHAFGSQKTEVSRFCPTKLTCAQCHVQHFLFHHIRRVNRLSPATATQNGVTGIKMEPSIAANRLQVNQRDSSFSMNKGKKMFFAFAVVFRCFVLVLPAAICIANSSSRILQRHRPLSFDLNHTAFLTAHEYIQNNEQSVVLTIVPAPSLCVQVTTIVAETPKANDFVESETNLNQVKSKQAERESPHEWT